MPDWLLVPVPKNRNGGYMLMGLFSRKTCAFCGGRVGILGYRIANDQYMCSDCRLKCTPGLPGDQISHMDTAAIRDNMAVMEEACRFYREQFRTSKRFCTGARRDKPVMLVDEHHDCWVNAEEREPYILRLSDILNYSIRLSTSEKDKDKTDLFDLFREDYGDRYPEIPSCPWGESVTGIYFTVHLADNSLGVTEVDMDLFPGLFSGQDDLRAAYDCAHEIFQFLSDYQLSGRDRLTVPASPVPQTGAEMFIALEKLNELLQKGILTQAEFDAKKKQILGL